VQFAVGFKIQGKTGHVVVDAEDALIAALKVKMQRPEALIAYVRQQNKRGDTLTPCAVSVARAPSSTGGHLGAREFGSIIQPLEPWRACMLPLTIFLAKVLGIY